LDDEEKCLARGDRNGVHHFLFYSNLLMGEFERSGMGRNRGLVWALSDIFTAASFGIAVVAAIIGYGLVECLRNRW
jgi:hypothetical protein